MKTKFNWEPLLHSLKEKGVDIVAIEAVENLIKHLEEQSQRLLDKAIEITKRKNKSKVTSKEIIEALEEYIIEDNNNE